MDPHCVLCDVRTQVLYACLCNMRECKTYSLSDNISLATHIDIFLAFHLLFKAGACHLVCVCYSCHDLCLSACISRALTGRVCVKTDIAEFHEDLSRNSKHFYNRAKLSGVLREAQSKFHYYRRNQTAIKSLSMFGMLSDCSDSRGAAKIDGTREHCYVIFTLPANSLLFIFS